jgi:hypothetical protein
MRLRKQIFLSPADSVKGKHTKVLPAWDEEEQKTAKLIAKSFRFPAFFSPGVLSRPAEIVA